MHDCTCGTTRPHVIARRSTADGVSLEFWSDGAVTGRMGMGLYGGVPLKSENLPLYLQAAQLVAGEVCLYEASEVRQLVRVARQVLTTEQPLVELRRRMALAQ